MKIFLFFLFLFSFSIQPVASQTSAELLAKADAKAMAIRKNENEIEFDARNILAGYYGFTYKRKLEEKRYVRTNEKRQLRLGFTLFTDWKFREQKSDSFDTVKFAGSNFESSGRYFFTKKRSRQDYNFGIGYEFQKGLKQKFTVFCGADLYTGFSNRIIFHQVPYKDASGSPTDRYGNKYYFYEDLEYSSISLGIIPFGGVRYYIFPYLSVGVQVRAIFGYQFDSVLFGLDKSTYKSHSFVADFQNTTALSVNIGF